MLCSGLISAGSSLLRSRGFLCKVMWGQGTQPARLLPATRTNALPIQGCRRASVQLHQRMLEPLCHPCISVCIRVCINCGDFAVVCWFLILFFLFIIFLMWYSVTGARRLWAGPT